MFDIKNAMDAVTRFSEISALLNQILTAKPKFAGILSGQCVGDGWSDAAQERSDNSTKIAFDYRVVADTQTRWNNISNVCKDIKTAVDKQVCCQTQLTTKC